MAEPAAVAAKAGHPTGVLPALVHAEAFSVRVDLGFAGAQLELAWGFGIFRFAYYRNFGVR